MHAGNHEVICILQVAEQQLHEAALFMQGAANRRQPASQQEPAAWQEIFENVYLHRKRREEKEEHISTCNCIKPIDASLGCKEDCLNRMLSVECRPVSAAHTDACKVSIQRLLPVLPVLCSLKLNLQPVTMGAFNGI